MQQVLRRFDTPKMRGLILGVIVISGVLLRLIHLNHGGLWLDEIWSMRTSASHRSVLEIIEDCIADTHPPLFDILLHYWLVLFGDSDLAGRSLALFFGLAGIIATGYYARLLSGNSKAAIAATALVSFHFFHIYYSNEVRFYSFIYLLSLIVFARFWLLIRKGSLRNALFYVLFSVALLYTHYYGVLLVAALSLTALLLGLGGKISRATLGKVTLAGLVILAAFAPWIPVLLSGTPGESWMKPPSVLDFAEYLYLYTGKNPVELLFIVCGLFFFFRRSRDKVVLSAMIAGTVLFTFFFALAASYAVVPMLHERYTMVYLPLILIAVAIGWTSDTDFNLPFKPIAWFVLICAVAVNLHYVNPYFKSEGKEPWKAVAEYLKDNRNESSAAVYTEMGFWIDYYLIKNELPKSKPIQGLKTDREEALRLITPYDQLPDTLYEKYLLDERDFGKGFRLQRLILKDSE